MRFVQSEPGTLFPARFSFAGRDNRIGCCDVDFNRARSMAARA